MVDHFVQNRVHNLIIIAHSDRACFLVVSNFLFFSGPDFPTSSVGFPFQTLLYKESIPARGFSRTFFYYHHFRSEEHELDYSVTVILGCEPKAFQMLGSLHSA